MHKVEEIVTIKEIYERVIILETKMDVMSSANAQGRRHFTKMVYLIIGSVLLDIAIHFVLFAMN